MKTRLSAFAFMLVLAPSGAGRSKEQSGAVPAIAAARHEPCAASAWDQPPKPERSVARPGHIAMCTE